MKIDVKKVLKDYYDAPSSEAAVINIPAMNYIMIDGEGNPNTAQAYKDAVELLYCVAYTL